MRKSTRARLEKVEGFATTTVKRDRQYLELRDGIKDNRWLIDALLMAVFGTKDKWHVFEGEAEWRRAKGVADVKRVATVLGNVMEKE